MKDLPQSLRNEVQQHILASFILNWEAFPKNSSIGVVHTIIKKLKLQIVPRNEFVIRAGSLAEEMYFIVKGCCRVQSVEGIELAILKRGQNFGEMGLLGEDNPLRQASVVTITKCSLAVLTKRDF